MSSTSAILLRICNSLRQPVALSTKCRFVLAPDPAQVETDDAAVPFPQRQLGVQRFQKRTLARSDPADQIDHFARVDRQVHVGKDQVLHAFVSFE